MPSRSPHRAPSARPAPGWTVTAPPLPHDWKRRLATATPSPEIIECTAEDRSDVFVADLVTVDAHAPRWLKGYVETLAYYFRREFDYDAVQYEAISHRAVPAWWSTDVSEARDVAYLWITRGHIDEREHAVGACCVRWRTYADAPSAHALAWIWMHPYTRGKGLLSASWPTFTARFGTHFLCEPPLSPAMRAFLVRQRWWQVADHLEERSVVAK